MCVTASEAIRQNICCNFKISASIRQYYHGEVLLDRPAGFFCLRIGFGYIISKGIGATMKFKIDSFLQAGKLFLLISILSVSVTTYAKSITGKVVKVKDGDSIVLLRNRKQYEIRLVNIDCPEHLQAFGTQARHFTSNLIFGKMVRAEYASKDKYGRLLAEVFLPDGRSLNRDLVRNGFAWKYDRYTDDSTLEILEQQARKNKLGLWKDPNPVPPWEFRRKK